MDFLTPEIFDASNVNVRDAEPNKSFGWTSLVNYNNDKCQIRVPAKIKWDVKPYHDSSTGKYKKPAMVFSEQHEENRQLFDVVRRVDERIHSLFTTNKDLTKKVKGGNNKRLPYECLPSIKTYLKFDKDNEDNCLANFEMVSVSFDVQNRESNTEDGFVYKTKTFRRVHGEAVSFDPLELTRNTEVKLLLRVMKVSVSTVENKAKIRVMWGADQVYVTKVPVYDQPLIWGEDDEEDEYVDNTTTNNTNFGVLTDTIS